MSRLMSVAMTTDAVIERRKTVTRRKGWWLDRNERHLLKVGDTLTLYVDPDIGIAYRLRSYGTDWRSEPFDPTKKKPDYSVLLVDGGGSTVRTLPPGAIEVWRPTAEEFAGKHLDHHAALGGAK